MTSSSHYPAGLENLSASSLLLENDITMKGWLMKKSGRDKIALTQRGQYDSRFVVIYRGWVYYYKDKNSEKPQGSFSLENFSDRVPPAGEEQSPSIPYVFKVYPKAKSGRTWFFATPDSKSMDDWREAFRNEIATYNNKPSGSNLKGSFSMPEKTRKHLMPAPHEVAQERSMSMSKVHPRAGLFKNSMSSSKSSESRESLNSIPPEDRLFSTDDRLGQENNDQLSYEPVDSEEYDGQTKPSFPSYSKNAPSFSPPRHLKYPSCDLPRLPDPLLEQNLTDEYFYDTIDESDVLSNPATFFPFPRSVPLPLPSTYAKKPKLPEPPEKLSLSRISSIPTSSPPEPPTNKAPCDTGVYEDPEYPRRLSNLQDKPLPPLPNSRNVHNEEMFDRRVPMPSPMERENVAFSELDPKLAYDDTVECGSRRYHSESCLENETCASQSVHPTSLIFKHLPMPPNPNLKPQVAIKPPLKPAWKKEEKPDSTTTPKKDVKTTLSPPKPTANTDRLNENNKLLLPPSKLFPKTSPKIFPSNFEKAISNQAVLLPSRIADKPIPSVGPKNISSNISQSSTVESLTGWNSNFGINFNESKSSAVNRNEAPRLNKPRSATNVSEYQPPAAVFTEEPNLRKLSSNAAFDDSTLSATDDVEKPSLWKLKPTSKFNESKSCATDHSDKLNFSRPKPTTSFEEVKPLAGDCTKEVKPLSSNKSNLLSANPNSSYLENMKEQKSVFSNKPEVSPKPSPTEKFSGLKSNKESKFGLQKPIPNSKPQIAPRKNIPAKPSDLSNAAKLSTKNNFAGQKPTNVTGLTPGNANSGSVQKSSPKKTYKPETSTAELSKKFSQNIALKGDSKTSQSGVSQPDLGTVSNRAKMFGASTLDKSSTSGIFASPALKRSPFKS